jgi:hypothetical protein
MKRVFLLALLLSSCGTAQRLEPVRPEPIDWKKCPAVLSVPAPHGGWKNEKWIWKDDYIAVERNNHFCMDVLAKSSEENQRRVLRNARAYEEKRASLSERIGYWLQGAAIPTLLLLLKVALL